MEARKELMCRESGRERERVRGQGDIMQRQGEGCRGMWESGRGRETESAGIYIAEAGRGWREM